MIDSQLDKMIEPSHPWKDKVFNIHQWLNEAEDVVLLCDEPSMWLPDSNKNGILSKFGGKNKKNLTKSRHLILS